MSGWSKKFVGHRWLRLLKTLGCCLGVSPPSSKRRYLHLMWSIVLLGWIWFVCFTLVIGKSQMKVLAIEKLLYLLEYPSNMIITALFSLSVYRNGEFFRRQSVEQLHLMGLLNASPRKLFGTLEEFLKKCLFMIFCFHGICVVIDVCCMRFDLVQTLFTNSAHNLVGLIISISLLQYVSDLMIVQLLYLRLNDHLRKTQRQPILKTICILSPPAFDKVQQHLEEIRLIFNALDALQMKLVKRFGPVFLVNFLNSLLSFSYELFNVLRILEQAQWSDVWILFIYRLLWLLMHGLRVWSTLIANGRIVEQKSQLCLLLNKLEVEDSLLEESVNRFLLQLQTNGSHGCPATACGLIDLDTLAVGGFVTALSAIIIFLIQIELGNKSLMGYSF